MAVEWLRSCYESEWFLFRDDPTRVTAGEYYFSPAGTPFYPGWHRLGARTWHDANWQHAQTLGESLTSKQTWDDGDVPTTNALAIFIGDPDCIANGELVADSVPSGELPFGFAEGCLRSIEEEDRLWEMLRDYENCQVQKVHAFLVQALYVLDDDAIVKTVRDWLGPLPVIAIHHHAGPRPGLITIALGDWMLAILDGTWEFQEFALQAFAFVVGPTNKGAFSTAELWWQSATYINNLMNDDGQVAGGRLMMVGHSYGGAVALVSAARYKLWAPTREIVYLTFGTPKIGDQRFVDIVRTLEGLNLAHQNDIVTTLPPDKITLAPLVALFPGVPLFLYTEWQRPYPQAMIRLDGELDYQTYPLMDTATIIALVTQAVLHLDFMVIEAHKMPRYQILLQNRCPDPHWPIDEEVNFDVFVSDQALAFNTPLRPRGSLVFNHVSIAEPATPITPGPPPFPGTLPDFALGVLYVYIGGVQPPIPQGLKLLGVAAGTYRLTIQTTAPMGALQGIEMRTQIPPTWAIDNVGSLGGVGFVDVAATSSGEGIALIFFDLSNTQTWNVVFRVDLLP